ncbi:hypothetical protein [Coleofasciculus sp. E1-EBD-02]|uniref:hypothetical protein n=1 Tax=Coleofasciculus sp. E1-EBD-02 TaxID=3068481 RepID=UPI0032FF1654
MMRFEWVGAGLAFLVSLLIITFIERTPSKSKILDGDCAQLFRSKPALRVNQSSALKWTPILIQSALADFRC